MLSTETHTITKHSKIFTYWKDKCIRNDGKIFKEGEIDYSISIPVVYDWGEPQCWCCGAIVPAEKNQKYLECLNGTEDDLAEIYNFRQVKSVLQKAHIVPHSLGGKDTPENLFLLCKKCHQNSPDTKSRTMFFKYIYQKRKCFQDPFGTKSYLDILEQARQILCEDYGIMKPVFDTKYLFYPAERVISSHCGNIEDSTNVYYHVLVALENKTALNERDDKLFRYFLNQKIEEIEDKYRNARDNISEIDKILLDTYKSVLAIYNQYKTIEMAELDS